MQPLCPVSLPRSHASRRPLTCAALLRPLRRGLLHATPNMNLVNLALRVLGPQTERMLCVKLLVFQAFCCGLGFGARWMLAGWWKA